MDEPWLRQTLQEVDAVRRQILHAFTQASEDVDHWCSGLTDGQMHAQPAGLPPVAFHLRHIARSLDRLLTYAEDRPLSERQLALIAESEPFGSSADVLAEFATGLADASRRVLRLSPHSYEQPRYVGRRRLKTTLGGLLVHCAEHTQRHVGQAITTARIVAASERLP